MISIMMQHIDGLVRYVFLALSSRYVIELRPLWMKTGTTSFSIARFIILPLQYFSTSVANQHGPARGFLTVWAVLEYCFHCFVCTVIRYHLLFFIQNLLKDDFDSSNISQSKVLEVSLTAFFNCKRGTNSHQTHRPLFRDVMFHGPFMTS